MIPVTKSDLPPLERYIEHLKKIWTTRWLTNNGEFVKLLESRLEEYLKVKNLMLVSNGTLALEIALRALNINGEVITTPFTFAATTNAILWEGATPIFADINPETFNIDPHDVEEKLTDKTTAILAVHVYGNPCFVKELQEIAREHSLKLIYDAAHAFSVEYENNPISSYGDITTLSFHATKVFNTIEGGAIIAKGNETVEKMKLLRNHGIMSEEQVVIPGTNAKMNEFQAIMGICNLENIEDRINSRKKLYEYYISCLANIEEIKFQKIVASKYNYSYMPILVKSKKMRDNLYSKLIENGIKPRKYFFPLTVDFDYFKGRGENLVEKYGLRNSRDISNRVLCLPLYPDLEMHVVDKIADIIEEQTAV